VYRLVEEARDKLFKKLIIVRINIKEQGGVPQVPPIDWENIIDQPSEAKIRWSFLDDERNQFAVYKQ
jgi:hypothetical protein